MNLLIKYLIETNLTMNWAVNRFLMVIGCNIELAIELPRVFQGITDLTILLIIQNLHFFDTVLTFHYSPKRYMNLTYD